MAAGTVPNGEITKKETEQIKCSIFFAPPFVLDALHQQLQKATTKEFGILK